MVLRGGATDAEDDYDLGLTQAHPHRPHSAGGPRYSALDMCLTIGFYMVANAGLSVFQKLAVTSVPLPFFLVAVQVAATLLMLLPFSSTIRMGTRDDMRKFLPVSCCFFLMLAGSMIAYQYCTLGTIVVVGSASPLITLVLERTYFVDNKTVITSSTLMSLGLTVAGVILYGVYKSELEAQMIGMIALISKIIIAIYYQTRQRYLMVEDPVDISDTGMMVYNNVVTLVGTCIVMYPAGEYAALPDITTNWRGHVYVGASCLFCGVIGYLAFRAQRRVTATTFLIIVNVCKIAVVLFGWGVLGEEYNWQSGIACGMVMVGASWYGWDRKMVKERISSDQGELFKAESTPEDWGLLEEGEWSREKRVLQKRKEQPRDF